MLWIALLLLVFGWVGLDHLESMSISLSRNADALEEILAKLDVAEFNLIEETYYTFNQGELEAALKTVNTTAPAPEPIFDTATTTEAPKE